MVPTSQLHWDFHLPQSSSASRFTAGASGFFILSQSDDRRGLARRHDVFEPERHESSGFAPSYRTSSWKASAALLVTFSLPMQQSRWASCVPNGSACSWVEF